MKGQRAARSAKPPDPPLDAGAVRGTDPWQVVDDVHFCHWDRWLLRLALEESDGLRTIARQFRGRTQQAYPVDEFAEAMLAQIADLEARLASLGLTPLNALSDIERASHWLRKKTCARIWNARAIHRTSAMMRTPRTVLQERALTGNWCNRLAFPVSPVPYRDVLKRLAIHRAVLTTSLSPPSC